MATTLPFLKTSRGYSMVSGTSNTSDDELPGSPESSSSSNDLRLEKGLFDPSISSRTRRILWKKAFIRVLPIFWILVGVGFVFACGFHLGTSVTLYNLEAKRMQEDQGLKSAVPSNSTYDSGFNSTATNNTDVAVLEEGVVDEEEDDIMSRIGDDDEDRPLITYVYFETENARQNAIFFIRHGLHAQADFIFIINGKTDLIDHIPIAPNIQIIQRNNTCFDLGSHAEVLTANNSTLIKKYNRFIMMNASIRGPFLPTWSKECWSDAYLDQLSDTNKLVGMTMRCNADKGKRKVMHSMLYATDRIGLQVLLPVLNHCFPTFWKAVGAEERAAQTMLNAGYNVTVLMSSFRSSPNYTQTCMHGEVLGDKRYFGTSLHPYETIFQKANRKIFPRQLELLTKWHDQSGYSSWEACYNKRKMMGPKKIWRRRK
ncbi:hypothetical protein TWF481_001953 [Arthrobotrys musiformis]|uniref:Uncharacterized protein n=1 Tax=Arthrobotrys musiformis TaxID=47236 RepID=A0AAV9VUU1_9PEZI